MKIEHLIIMAMWLFGLVGFILFSSRKNRRKGFFALMVFQAIIWYSDLLVYKFDLIDAPVRLLPKAIDFPFTINYFFYPVLFSIYYVNKKEKSSQSAKFTYFFIWISAITLFDVMIERFTDLLEYKFMTWYGKWIYIGFLFYVSKTCCNGFFKDKSKLDGGKSDEY